jgi:hypothetical protein
MREVYLVLLEFGQARERQALDLLTATLRRLFPSAILRTADVDNAANGREARSIGEGIERLGGDNTLREFSGWDRGLAWLERRYAPAADSIFVLANDTVVRADKHDRVRDIPTDRAAAAADGALVGWIDEYPRAVELFGQHVRQWVDTSLLIAARDTLGALRPLGRIPDDTGVFADSWRGFFREPSPLSRNYRDYLRTYFFGERLDAEFEHAWYGQAPLTAANAEAFRTKLRAVFCEHLLGARARAEHIPLVDIRPTPLRVDPF